MRAGKLDKLITIERSTHEIDRYGNPVYTWVKLADLRAQVVQASTEEFIRAYGAIDETLIIFRTHYFEGILNSDSISFEGMFFNIKETKEIGRRQGLEIRAIARGAK